MVSGNSPIDYDQLVDDYSTSLVDKLRGHGAAGTFFDHWVPDEDPVRGIINLIEAAEVGGVPNLTIRVSASKLKSSEKARLERAAEGLAVLAIQPDGASHIIVQASKIGGSAARTRAGKAQAALVVPVRQIEREAQFARAIEPINSELMPGVLLALKEISHEGLQIPQAGGQEIGTFEHDGATVQLTMSAGGIIQRARHHGIASPHRRAVVDLMCRLIEGRPLQDGSDHAGTLAIDWLRAASGAKRPVPGVLLTGNAGSEIASALAMIRGACRALAKPERQKTENTYQEPPSSGWLSLSKAEQLKRIESGVQAFRRARALPDAAIRTLALDPDLLGHPVRVLVELSDDVTTHEKPGVLRQLETWLKSSTEAKLQVHLEPVKDRNTIRRL